MVSACLAGKNCKYNGGNNRNDKIMRLMEENEVITVCPEKMGGLPTPRVPSEVKDGVVTAKDGRIVDKEFRAGAAKCLEIAMREQPDLIVLRRGASPLGQSRSPSCGVNQRYDGTFSGTQVDGAGVMAQLLMKHGFLLGSSMLFHKVLRPPSIWRRTMRSDIFPEAIFTNAGSKSPQSGRKAERKRTAFRLS